MPKFSAPKLGTSVNTVAIDADVPANASGVLYALGGFSGGLSTYMQDSRLCYEYNLFEIARTKICTKEKVPAGRTKIEVETATKPLPACQWRQEPLSVSHHHSARQRQRCRAGHCPTPGHVALHGQRNCLDFGTDLGSPVSMDYFDKAPFPFTGTIIGGRCEVPARSGNQSRRRS